VVTFLLGSKCLKDANDKWLVRSAFQKAIRRGQVLTALKMGGYLYNEDPSYFWYSLVTVAYEDIGFAQPQIVVDASSMFRWKTYRKKLDERKEAARLIHAMCVGKKTRAFCELSLGVDLSIESGSMNVDDLVSMDNDALFGVITTGSNIESYLGLLLAYGKMLPASIARSALRDRLRMELPGLVDAKYAALVEMSLWMHFDTMTFSTYPLCRGFISLDGTCIDEASEPTAKIRGVHLEAYDMHNHTGKYALKAFHTSLKKDYDAINCIKGNKAVKALGASVFVLEGGLENNRVMSPELQALKTFQDETFVIGYGVPEEKREDIMQIVAQEMPRLASKRKWASDLK